MAEAGKTSKSSPKVSKSPRQGKTAQQPADAIDPKVAAFVEASGSDLTASNEQTPTPVQQSSESLLTSDSDAPKRGRKKLGEGKRKIQTPIMIPRPLLDQVDEHVEALGTGMSRSVWICEAIKERLDRQRQSSS